MPMVTAMYSGVNTIAATRVSGNMLQNGSSDLGKWLRDVSWTRSK
jgi:hypothetical protein